MRALDANILLRLMLDDEPTQVAQARALLATGERFLLCETVLLEVAWVLKTQGASKPAIARALADLVRNPLFAVNDVASVASAIALVATGGDPGVAFHLVSARAADVMVTFDKEFVKHAKKAKSKPRVELA